MQQDEELYRKYMVHILSGLQYLHTLISPISHGDLTPSNILVDAGGNLKLTSISLTRISLSLPSEEQGVLFEGGINSARYMSPELLQDEACPTPQSDMWAFGNVAFWIHSGLVPYPEHKYEIAVIAQLNQGTPPNGSSQLEKLETLGGISIPEDILWRTNGTWASIMRCWNTDVRNRLTATQFLRELKIQSNISEISGATARWGISGVTDLTGRIKRSETRSYGPTLGWSQGVWRGAYDGRGNRVTHITLWCWRTTLSQGFFRSNIDVTVKGAQLMPTDSSTIAARQARIDQQFKEFSVLPGIVLEFCSNGTLQEYYSRKFNDLDDEDKKSLLRDIGNGVHYLHHSVSQGIVVHGNLSMDTVLVDDRGTLRLSNFEFACQYQRTDNILEAPVILAPPIAPAPSRWHAPEFFGGPKDSWPNPTQFTDMWAVGCLVVAAWTNKLPFAEFDSPGALFEIINGSEPYLRSDCNPQIWDIATHLWAIPHYDRISTTRFIELVAAL
ncbi:hypothetical protein FRC12_009548 [Ceratobasidium sp. 428]|nr:hypothetical protein FRC12_009548 [Ceratobasidium sp. 428]